MKMADVKVDWKKCNGDGVCVDVCPVEVFELQDLTEMHPMHGMRNFLPHRSNNR